MDSSAMSKDHVGTWKLALRVNQAFLKDHLRKRDVISIADYLFQERCVDISFLSKIQNAATSRKAVLALHDHVHNGDPNSVIRYCAALKIIGRCDVLQRLQKSYDEHYPAVNSGTCDRRRPTFLTALLLKLLSAVIGATYVYVRFFRSKLYEQSLPEHGSGLSSGFCKDHIDTWKLALRVNRVFLMDHLRKREVISIADYLFQERCVEENFFCAIERATASPKAVIELMDHVHQGDRHCVITYCTALRKIGRDDVLQRLEKSYNEFYPVLDPGAYDRRPPHVSMVLVSKLLSAACASLFLYARFLAIVPKCVLALAALLLKLCSVIVFSRTDRSIKERCPKHSAVHYG